MSSEHNFDATYEALRDLMIPYANDLDLKADVPGNLYIDTNHIMKNGKQLFFGAVETKKRYVSFHIMPVYVNPDLLDSLSDELRQRMHGKSCFNFSRPDGEMFAELAELTRAGFDDYRKRGYI